MPSVTDNTSRPDNLHDALEALQQASSTPAKQRKSKASIAVDAICHHAFQHGLDSASLKAIVVIVTRRTELDQSSVTNLVKNLYPAHLVSADVVVTIIGALGQGKSKPSTATQLALLKWLVTVYEIIEDPKTLSRLYGVLFGLLDMISLRTSLCHLLSLITRRKHVRPFRIQQLLDLSRGLGSEPALQGLLRVYKDYYPDIILGSTAAGRNSFPPQPDPEWRKRFLAIHDASARRAEGSLVQQNGFRVLRQGVKRSKVSVIPEVHTFHANETSVTLEEIDNVDDFVEKLEKIELPGQIISSLKDPLLQKYLSLNPSNLASRRVDLWLLIFLEDEFEAVKRGDSPSTFLSEIFEAILGQTRYTKSIPPIIDAFLKEYLLIWNGVADDDAILELLAFLPVQQFQGIHTTYLAPVEAALISNNPDAYRKLVNLYTSILYRWAAQAPSQGSTTSSKSSLSYTQTITDLAKHVSTLALSILSAFPHDSNSPTISSILTFYEALSASSIPTVIPIILPPPHTTYLLLTCSSLATLTRLLTVLANYKNAFDTHPTPISAHYPATTTNTFNGYLMDTCNLLWRSRALLTADPNAQGCFCDPGIRATLQTYIASVEREYVLSSAFGLSHNSLLAALSAAAWRSLEEAEIQNQGPEAEDTVRHKGPVTQRNLVVLAKEGGVEVPWKKYRIEVLKWLEQRGCRGVKDLMFATMTGLKEAAA
ncbi:Mis6-domain-containing protein [Glonium stellatum]|uniref:Mis6-domain-containing protein n=1 Tax=Glonium stellatum TaxID=574774 RepID=A0A8E2FAY8_9PEZI|nr:Mis6-domain-containing protein [Glonium stellatum]